MTIPLQDSPSLILVKVPKDATDFSIDHEYNYLIYNQRIDNLGNAQRSANSKTEFPLEVKGDLKLMGRVSDILKDEELCEELRLSRLPSDIDADDFLIVKIL